MSVPSVGSLWNVGTEHYLALSLMLFGIGLFGVINRRNLITILMSIELMLNAVNLNLVAFSYQRGDLLGQVFTVFTITVAAGEAAVGLGILLAMFRLRQTTRVDAANELEG
jgi:NADH-quinone oxidoreductase subunit K